MTNGIFGRKVRSHEVVVPMGNEHTQRLIPSHRVRKILVVEHDPEVMGAALGTEAVGIVGNQRFIERASLLKPSSDRR